MPELPQWATNAIIGVIAAVSGWIASRRVNSATATEKEANAQLTLTKVSAELARQLQAVQQEVPVWKQQIATETARAELAEGKLRAQSIVEAEARNIVEEMSHIAYMKAPDEEETIIERRFKRIKQSANRIADILKPKE